MQLTTDHVFGLSWSLVPCNNNNDITASFNEQPLTHILGGLSSLGANQLNCTGHHYRVTQPPLTRRRNELQ